MHNRDFIWETEKGELLKLKDIKTNHLENIIKFLKAKGFDSGDFMVKLANQELRYRKLNNIENNPDNKDLF